MSSDEVLKKVDPLLAKGNYIEAIQVLEEELSTANSLEQLASISRKLSHLYRYGVGQEGKAKAVDYALMAGMAYVRGGRMGPAVAMLKTLGEICASDTILEEFRAKISDAFSRPKAKRAPQGDEHLPVPTPYSEFKAKISLESFGDSELRAQFDVTEPQKVPLFSVLSQEEVRMLLDLAVVRDMAPGSVLFREGDLPGGFYVVSSGELQLESSAGFQKSFREGEFFGEVALLGNMRRTATIVTAEGAEVIEISKEALQRAFKSFPYLENRILSFYEFRLFMNVAARSLFFQGLDELELEDALDYFTPIHVPAGRVLIEQGAISDRMFFVVKGFLEVYKDELAVCRLGPGQFVGEIGMIKDVPRTARVMALSDCHLLEIDQAAFKSFAESYPQVEKAISNIAELRLTGKEGDELEDDESTVELDISKNLVVD